MVLHARTPGTRDSREIHLDMDFASEGGRTHRTRSCCPQRCAVINRTSRGRDSVEETWRIVQPLIDEPPAVEVYEQGTWVLPRRRDDGALGRVASAPVVIPGQGERADDPGVGTEAGRHDERRRHVAGQ